MGAIKQESGPGDLYPATTKAVSVARFSHYKELLLRRWWLLAVGLTVGLGVGAAFWWCHPPVFVSVGRMIVSIKLAIPEGSVYSEELGNFLGTQAALMRSGVVLNRAQARMLAAESGMVLVPPELKVAVSPKTSIFVLEATGSDPKCTQSFLQACMEEYIKLKQEMRTQTSDTTVAGLTEELVRLEKNLRVSEEELVGFQRSNSVALLEDQGNSAGTYVATLHQRLAALKAEDALLQSLAPAQISRANSPESTHVSRTSSPLDPPDVSLKSFGEPPASDMLKSRQQVLLLKAEQQELGHYLRSKHPKMIALSEDIARREGVLEILEQQNARELETRKKSLARQMDYLEQGLSEWNARALECSQKAVEFQRLKANQQRTQTLYDRLLATLQTLDLNREISPESVTILEPATTAVPEGRKPFKQFFTAGLIAVVLSVAVLLFLDHVDDRVNSLTELQTWFAEPVLAQVPRQRTSRKNPDVTLLDCEDVRHGFLEVFRSLRSSLLFQTPDDKKPKSLLITSAVPNEGKSLTSANLAIVMASANARVLLVDADLRKGALHRRFGLTAGNAGLTEALSGRVHWEEAVLPTRYPGLSLLGRGTPSLISSELFLADSAHRFLSEAVAKYDFVILDAPPVMAADDVTSLAPRADAVLFVLRAEHTSARVARASLEMLYRRQVSVLGLVFNAVRPGNSDYCAYRGYTGAVCDSDS